MKILDNYLKLQLEIFNYFGYKEDWKSIPIEDSRQYYWKIIGKKTNGDVRFADTMEQLLSNGDYYVDEIYTQRFLPKWVYEGKEFTMICTDPGSDGNKFLRIFDNKKEVK